MACLWATVLGLGVLVLALMRQVGVMLLRIGPRPPKQVEGLGPRVGDLVDLEHAGSEGISSSGSAAHALVFVSPTCTSCEFIPGAVKSLVHAYTTVEFRILVDGDGVDVENYVRRHRTGSILVLPGSDLRRSLNVNETPFAVLLAPDGRVLAQGISNNREHLEELLRAGAASEVHRDSMGDHVGPVPVDLTAKP
jgi:methylamine dehydrogenase accessory protein MauD